MAHVCPWWGGYFIDNSLRRWIHNPERILQPYLTPGMTVLDFGCGMGIFSIAMAELVGETGHVIAVDLQPQMLKTLKKRATKAGLAERIELHQCPQRSIDLDTPVDFALAFYSAHEVPDVARLLSEIRGLVRSRGRLFLVEPVGHVPRKKFASMLDYAAIVGFQVEDRPRVHLSHTALLQPRSPASPD